MIILHHLIHQIITNYIFKKIVSNNTSVKKFEKAFKVMSDINKKLEPVSNKTETETKTDEVEFVLHFDPPVYCQRYSAVHQILIDSRWAGTVKKVVDFGCAEFGLFNYVKHVIGLQEVLFVDVDLQTLEQYIGRLYPLNVDYLRRRNEPLNLKVLNGSIAYPSLELLDVDAILCIEIIEHLYPDTLEAVPYNILGVLKPRIAVFTTPNADFNVLFPNFLGFRHWDHKFEWTREQFEDWANNVAARFPDYTVSFEGIGAGPKGTEKYGKCSQMAVFIKTDAEPNSFDVEYKNYFSNKEEIDTCQFCEFKKNYQYDFVSYGICTYFSNNLNYFDEFRCGNELFCNCVHSEVSCKEIAQIAYPFEVDNRTQDERILHDITYKIFRLGNTNSRFYNEELDQAEIPLCELYYTSLGEMISEEHLKRILQTGGYTIKECLIRGENLLCVIYTPNDSSTMSKSSRKTKSTDPKIQDQSDNDSNWDDEIIDEAPSELTTDSLPPDIIDNEEKKDISNPLSDIGESSNSPNKKIECLYNSGCPASSSSIEMVTPELIKSMQKGKIAKSEAIKAKSEQENVKPIKNQLKRQTMNNPNLRLTVMKSDGNIKLQNIPETPESQESGPTNPQQTPQPATSESQNFENENQNHCLHTRRSTTEPSETDSCLENVSQEVVYDVNSENNLSDIDILSGEQLQIYQELLNPVITSSIPVRIVTADDSERNNFPAWLLHLLQVSEDDGDSVLDAEPHFYSQGDGLGIHPSLSQITTDSSDSDVTLQIPTIIQTIPFLERMETPSSENDNSDDYYSIDEDMAQDINNAVTQTIVTNLQNDLSRVFSESNNIGPQATTNTPVTENSQNSVEHSPESKESKTNIPGTSSKKKD